MSQTISSIVVNYDAGPLLRGCVDSLLPGPLDVEIIVVDNASGDGSLNELRESSHICIFRNPANLGVAAACNIGVRAAAAPFSLFLNLDCYFQPGTVAMLLAALASGDRVGLVHGLLVDEEGIEQGGFADRWSKVFNDFHIHNHLPSCPIEVEAR